MSNFDKISVNGISIIPDYNDYYLTIYDDNKYLFNSNEEKTNNSISSFYKIDLKIQFDDEDICYSIQLGSFRKANSTEPILVGSYAPGTKINITYKKENSSKIKSTIVEVIQNNIYKLSLEK